MRGSLERQLKDILSLLLGKHEKGSAVCAN